MKLKSALYLLATVPPLLVSASAEAKSLTGSEVRSQMLNKTIVTRRFGLSIRLRYKPGGIVTAKTLLGSLNGTWRASGNKVCTTFPSGPAKGTECVSFTKTGPNQYRSSKGVRFRVVN